MVIFSPDIFHHTQQNSQAAVQNQQVPLFSLPIMLLCIFVSFLTVALALRKPMKIVSRISPIEATRYLENAETHSEDSTNSSFGITRYICHCPC